MSLWLKLSPDLNPLLRCKTVHCSSFLSCMNEYLAIDSVIFMYEYLCALIVTWLDASQRSRDGVRLNRSVRE